MIVDLIFFHWGDVLEKELDIYWASEMEIYLDNILACGYIVESQKAEMVEYLVVYHLSAMLSKYLSSELIMATTMVWNKVLLLNKLLGQE